MARIGLAWDIGAGRGHAVPVAALALAARRAGHEPLVFARDLRTQRECLASGIALLPAPHNDWVPEDARAPATWADVLWNEAGLHDARQCIAIARAWRDLLEALRVDALLVDAAPLAHLAAASLGLRSVAIGTGFLVPPDGPPWPVFRDWEPVDMAAIAARQDAVAARIDEIGAALGVDVDPATFGGSAHCLFTRPPLDHYPQRRRGEHVGPLAGTGAAPAWPAGPRRAFVYLQPDYPHLGSLLAALSRRADVAVLAYAGGARPADAARVAWSERPLDLRSVLAQADLVVGHGGSLAVLAAEAGVPQLCLPTQAEMFMTARRVVALGIGRAVTPYDPLDFDAPLTALLDDPALRARARQFARDCPAEDDAARVARVLGCALAKGAAPD